MKKILFSLLLVVFVFTSCEDKTAYTITGTTKNVADDTQVLLYADRRGKEVLGTTTVKDGKFTFEGKQEEPIVKFVKVEGLDAPNNRPWAVVVEPGSKIKIDFDGQQVVSIKGTLLNEKNSEFWKTLGEKEVPDSELLFSFIKSNADNVLGIHLFESNFYSFSLEQLKEIVALVSEKYKTSEAIVKIENNIAAQEVTKIGNKFVDIKGLSPEGKEVVLSDYAGKGKVVLVDFWASWCPPCVADMPHLVAAYAKYKDKGFEIVGVTLDDKQAAWEKGIKDLGITWPQFSDLKGWKSEHAATYAVSSIPHTVLIDKDGTIINKKIGGAELDATLAELLK